MKNKKINKILSGIAFGAVLLGNLGAASAAFAAVEPATVKVTINKYIGNVDATALNANSTDFQMNAAWNATNIGAGTGQYALSASGFGGDPTPYQAITVDMTSGADYSTSEIMDANVGATCEAGMPFALVGYTTGDTAAEASTGTPSMTLPAFTGLTTDKYVVVWNIDCATVVAPTSTPTTNPATAISDTDATLNGTNGSLAASGHSFWVSTSTFSTASPTIPAGVYSTADLGALAPNAASSALLSSATGLPTVTPNTTYYFAAWSNVGGTWYPGAVLNFTTGSTGVGGTIGGDVTGGQNPNGSLQVTSITTVQNSATADGSFANGWKYVFHITAPTNETKLSMKFADWMSLVGSSTIPVANNVRISSLQANNAGATILITAANLYSSPDLTMTGDLDLATVGRQVDVTVEVAVPAGSVNGGYTTSYGVKTIQ
jgi:hypothetical protein